ncbi:hypothetical protein BDZ91DRAFT_739596 [Kalaharituber pfeilii]|nr:hypothetical protein BDZ91DRAFT_739596 [Kalaharituber pfeilii]
MYFVFLNFVLGTRQAFPTYPKVISQFSFNNGLSKIGVYARCSGVTWAVAFFLHFIRTNEHNL